MAWIEPGVLLQVFPDTQVEADPGGLDAAIAGADIVLGVALRSPHAVGFMESVSARKGEGEGTVICFDSDPSLEKTAVLGGVRVDSLPLPLLLLAKAGVWKKGSLALKVREPRTPSSALQPRLSHRSKALNTPARWEKPETRMCCIHMP